MTNPYPLPRFLRQTAVLEGNGGTVYGPFSGFSIWDTADIEVWWRPAGQDNFTLIGVAVAKTTADAFSPFTVTFPAGVPSSTQFVVASVRLHDRAAGLQSGTMLDPNALEKEISRQGTVLQELRRDVGRAIKMAFDNTGTPYEVAPGIGGRSTLVAENGRIKEGPTVDELEDWKDRAETAADEAEAARLEALETAGGLSALLAAVSTFRIEPFELEPPFDAVTIPGGYTVGHVLRVEINGTGIGRAFVATDGVTVSGLNVTTDELIDDETTVEVEVWVGQGIAFSTGALDALYVRSNRLATNADVDDLGTAQPNKIPDIVRVSRLIRNTGLFSITDPLFGAKLNGTTVDDAAFANFMDAAANFSVGKMLIPQGTARITAPIIDTSGVIFEGQGKGRTRFLCDPDITCIDFNFGGGGAGGDWGLRDLRIDYADQSDAGAAVDMDNAGSSSDAAAGVIHNVFISKAYNGIVLGNCQGVNINGLFIWYFTHHALKMVGDLNDPFISNVFINGEILGGGGARTGTCGWKIDGKAHAMLASNIEIIQCGQPADWYGQPDSIETVAHSRLFNVFFDSSLNPARFEFLRDVEFHGCWWSQRASGGQFYNSKNVKFFGGGATNCDEHGLLLEEGCLDFEFHGPTFDSNGQASSGTFSGLVVAEGVGDFKIFGGNFGNFGEFPARQQNGVLLLGSNDNYVIDGLTNRGGLGPLVFGHTASSTRRLMNCQGHITENAGTSAVTLVSGNASIPHGLVAAPTSVFVNAINAAPDTASILSVDATNINIRIINSTTGSPAAGSYSVMWRAMI